MILFDYISSLCMYFVIGIFFLLYLENRPALKSCSGKSSGTQITKLIGFNSYLSLKHIIKSLIAYLVMQIYSDVSDTINIS